MSYQSPTEMQQGQQEALPGLHPGVITRIVIPEQISQNGKKASEVVSDIVVQANAKNNKQILGEGVKDFPEVMGAKIAYGGQDCAGSAVFDGGRIQGIVVAADGCSFGDDINTAQAAKIAVETALRQGREISRSPNINRDDIQDGLVLAINLAHKRIQKEVPGGASTVVVAAISKESVGDGHEQTYLYVSSCGDAQLMIASEDYQGKINLTKIVEPADALDRQLRSQGLDLEKLPVNITQKKRDEAIDAMAAQLGGNRQLAEDALTQSGIYAYIGDPKTPSPQVRHFRVNLSQDRFVAGHRNVRIIACSDNAGEKLKSEEIIQSIQGSNHNAELAKKLNDKMAEHDADDGCLAILKVG